MSENEYSIKFGKITETCWPIVDDLNATFHAHCKLLDLDDEGEFCNILLTSISVFISATIDQISIDKQASFKLLEIVSEMAKKSLQGYYENE